MLSDKLNRIAEIEKELQTIGGHCAICELWEIAEYIYNKYEKPKEEK